MSQKVHSLSNLLPVVVNLLLLSNEFPDKMITFLVNHV